MYTSAFSRTLADDPDAVPISEQAAKSLQINSIPVDYVTNISAKDLRMPSPRVSSGAKATVRLQEKKGILLSRGYFDVVVHTHPLCLKGVPWCPGAGPSYNVSEERTIKILTRFGKCHAASVHGWYSYMI